MKKILLLLTLIIGVTVSCSKDTNENGNTNVIFTIENKDNRAESYTDGLVVIRNLTTNNEKQEKVAIEKNQFSLVVPKGLYNISFEATGESSTHKAYLESVNIVGEELNLSLSTFIYEGKEDFVIDELFYAGTVYPGTGKAYIGDQYIKITNNSDKTLYADGLTIAESAFTSNNRQNYTPNIMSTDVAVQAIYTIPGDGKQYPVEPGKSIILCDKAMNHKVEAHAGSFDLSKADFEWYDESSSSTTTDTDNPSVPNLEKVYCYTKSIWILHKGGSRSYILARLEATNEEYLTNYKYDYSYILEGFDKEVKSSDYRIPNAWILDAVTLSTPDKWAWNPIDASLDAGNTYCGVNSSDTNRYGTCVKRKKVSTTNSGRTILKDTNNSSLDFDRDVVPVF